jgi:thiamine pyrophosphate-dependent acetolactate synthase large subunit-like protein
MAPRSVQRRVRPVVSRDPRDVLDGKVDLDKAVIPKAGHYRASTKSIGDPADIERLADILVNAERPAVLLGQQVWTAAAPTPRASSSRSSTSRPT